MTENAFHRSISVDSALTGSHCEWCAKPAAVRLTAIGGASHNESGLFCTECGAQFVRAIAQGAAVSDISTEDVP